MTKKINIYLFLFFISSFLGKSFSQIRPAYAYYETHLVYSDSIGEFYYLYRIPNNHFVFTKDGNKYLANFRISIEVTDTLSNHIISHIEDKSILTDKYDETTSSSNYFQDAVKFNLPPGKYILHPVITDLNSNRDIKLFSVIVDLSILKNKSFYEPYIVDNELNKYGGKSILYITNFNNCIPFSDNQFNLIIPCIDTSLKEIYMRLLNNKDTIFSGEVHESFTSGIFPKVSDDKIVLDSSNKILPTKNFILKNFSRKLKEGILRIFILKNMNSDVTSTFIKDVVWFNKPFTLREPKEAIKLLKYIAKESTVDSILKFDTNDYSKILFDYWKKYDPDKSSEFNPLMNEYYLRADFAIKNFSTLSGKNGSETDRGKIFIKFGKPQRIERASNKYGKVVEKWIYKNPFREFEFIDQNGTGDYVLNK